MFARRMLCHWVGASLLISGLPAVTLGQVATKDESALGHAGKVMDTIYRQGAFEKAEAQLLGVLKACGEQCVVQTKARVWMYVGIVRSDGRHDPGLARQ